MQNKNEKLSSDWLKQQSLSEGFDLSSVEVFQRKVGRPFSGVLGDAEIRIGVSSGQLVIEPFDGDLLKSSSYDVRLGGHYYKAERVGHQVDFSPYDEVEVKNYYAGPYRAITHKEWCEKHRHQAFKGIGDDELIIVLAPGECILGHTVEYIGARYGATTMMKARSSLGRINISACDDAGWGDVGYINRWTMEIRNKNKDVWVPLVVGMPIGQVVFFWVAGATNNYGEEGHYQGGRDIRKIKQAWRPDGMLPQIYSDKNRQLRGKLKNTPADYF